MVTYRLGTTSTKCFLKGPLEPRIVYFKGPGLFSSPQDSTVLFVGLQYTQVNNRGKKAASTTPSPLKKPAAAASKYPPVPAGNTTVTHRGARITNKSDQKKFRVYIPKALGVSKACHPDTSGTRFRPMQTLHIQLSSQNIFCMQSSTHVMILQHMGVVC